MSHPTPGHDYSESHKEETRSDYARRKGIALGKAKTGLPKEYVNEVRQGRRIGKKLKKMNARFKALVSNKD